MRFRLSALAALIALSIACATGATRETPAATGTVAATVTGTPVRTASATGTGTPTAAASPSTTPLALRARRLSIPSLRIDAEIQLSHEIPDTSVPAPGCPARPPGGTTLTVPDHGIVTPDDAVQGLENRTWIFGHSRWQNVPGVLYPLQDVTIGDEVYVDGIDRRTGQALGPQRFLVDGIYLTDIDSGGALVGGAVPEKPEVLLQTSVREDGVNRPWLLDQQKIVAKSRNLIQGDVNDPCKYLLLFVVARLS